MPEPHMKISICSYQSGDFEVMLRDPESGEEVMLCGNQELTPDEFDLINKLAPACVWTNYIQV